MNRVSLIGLALAAALVAPEARAAEVLFPAPLHLTRTIDDPISKTRTVVEEYCYGNRVIAIRGPLTSIADYEKGELTQIDRDRGTYSVTTFETIAKGQRANANVDAVSKPEPKGTEMRAGKLADIFEARAADGASTRLIRVGVSREIALSRDALEVIIGSRYPNRRGEEHSIAIEAATPREKSGGIRAASASNRDYALPLEQSVDYEIDGETLRLRNVVTRVGHELPPSELITPPPGATLVESEHGKLEDRLREVDTLPQQKSKNK